MMQKKKNNIGHQRQRYHGHPPLRYYIKLLYVRCSGAQRANVSVVFSTDLDDPIQSTVALRGRKNWSRLPLTDVEVFRRRAVTWQYKHTHTHTNVHKHRLVYGTAKRTLPNFDESWTSMSSMQLWSSGIIFIDRQWRDASSWLAQSARCSSSGYRTGW